MKKLRCWWTRDGSQIKHDVKSIEEAAYWLGIQSELDLHNKNITWNAGGLEEFDEEMISEDCDGWFGSPNSS